VGAAVSDTNNSIGFAPYFTFFGYAANVDVSDAYSTSKNDEIFQNVIPANLKNKAGKAVSPNETVRFAPFY